MAKEEILIKNQVFAPSNPFPQKPQFFVQIREAGSAFFLRIQGFDNIGNAAVFDYNAPVAG